MKNIHYKAYFDGGIDVNPCGNMAIGCIVYEINGENKEVVYESCEYFKKEDFDCNTSNNVAEAMAASSALGFFELENLQGATIELIGDSKIILNRLQAKRYAKEDDGFFATYINEAIKQTESFSDIKFTWVSREFNREADALVAKAFAKNSTK